MAELVPGRNLVTTPDNDSPDTLVSGLFVFLGVIMDKVFKTYSEQRDILRRRGLITEHPRFFTNALQHDDYYNIINGYKLKNYKEKRLLKPQNDGLGWKQRRSWQMYAGS